MKKIIALLVLAVVCCSLSACFEDSAPNKEQAQSSSSEVAKEQVFSLNESAVFSDLKFTATQIKESDGTDFFAPEKGNTFVGVKFTVENISQEEQSVSTLLLFEGYVDDVKCEYSFSASCAFSEGTLDGTIAPGKKLVGWYALEVPKNWETIELNVQSNWLSNNPAKFVFEN